MNNNDSMKKNYEVAHKIAKFIRNNAKEMINDRLNNKNRVSTRVNPYQFKDTVSVAANIAWMSYDIDSTCRPFVQEIHKIAEAAGLKVVFGFTGTESDCLCLSVAEDPRNFGWTKFTTNENYMFNLDFDPKAN
tara:strand:- start:804 stop:1202 length:399 start_codon:yes stop_codon:yes gene_type:complete